MGYKIAVASSDGINSDLEFGQASQFYIYEVNDNKEIFFSEIREWTQEAEEESKNDSLTGSCNHQGNRCHKGGEKKVELLDDCRCIICTHIGPKISKSFTVRCISIFDIEGEIAPIIKKIVDYYK